MEQTELTGLTLERFLQAQDTLGCFSCDTVYDTALQQLTEGRKRTHWIWFILPQLRGLGNSDRAIYYGLADLQEARAYLRHPILGSRLLECCQALLDQPDCDPIRVMGWKVDARKLKSSMTLFHHVDPSNQVFPAVLKKFFDGQQCPKTLDALGLSEQDADQM